MPVHTASDPMEAILDTLMSRIAALEDKQDEGSDAMQLAQLVGVDVLDIMDNHRAGPPLTTEGLTEELTVTRDWLALYQSEHSAVVDALTALIESATA